MDLEQRTKVKKDLRNRLDYLKKIFKTNDQLLGELKLLELSIEAYALSREMETLDRLKATLLKEPDGDQ